MIIIPPRDTKMLLQTNRSKIQGHLWSSFNLDLQTSLGLIKASPRLMLNTGGVANQGIATAFATFDQRVFALCGTRIFKNSSFDLISPFVEDTSTGAITNYLANESDLLTFNQTLIAISDNKVMSKVNNGSGTGAWTKRADITGSTIHKGLVFKKYNRLYYLDAYLNIRSMDTSWVEATSGNYFLGFVDYSSGQPYTFAADSSNIWIGTFNVVPAGIVNSFQGASIITWDGISNTITSEYKIKAQGVLAMCRDDRGIMHAIDTNGALIAFTGDGFEEIGRLPLERKLLTNALNAGLYNAFVHPNGLTFSRNGTFLVNVNNLVGDSAGSVKENLPSGIWEFKKETGFVHRQSVSYTPVGTATITDYGQNRVSRAGALYEPNIYSESASGKPTLICGVDYYSDASTVVSGIFVDDPLNTTQKFSSFVTTWQQSQNLKDAWNKMALKYRKLLNAADKIWLKYRLTEADPVEFTLTWSSLSPAQTIFTTSTDLSSFVGYEVEVLQGTGSGKCAHIVTAPFVGGVCTVTLDEPFTGVTSGTAKARYQAWVKVFQVADQTTESIIRTIATSNVSERIQVKCCMQFTGDDELHEMIVINSPHDELQ